MKNYGHKKDELYISVDIEASGKDLNKHSMIALGSCVVGNTRKSFYRELKPLSPEYDLNSIKVASKGLECLRELRHLPEFNPEDKRFNPGSVLAELQRKGYHPNQVMHEYNKWLMDVSNEKKPIFIAFNLSLDWKFVDDYFNVYLGENPFGLGTLDIKTYFMGKLDTEFAGTTKKKIKEFLGYEGKHTHHALEDAIEQAEIFYKLKILNISREEA